MGKTREQMKRYREKANKGSNSNNWKSEDIEYRNNLLGRMESDIKYFLGNGRLNNNDLWAKNPKEQIETMKAIYNSMNAQQKKNSPLTAKDISNYEKKMNNAIKEARDVITISAKDYTPSSFRIINGDVYYYNKDVSFGWEKHPTFNKARLNKHIENLRKQGLEGFKVTHSKKSIPRQT